MSTPTPSLDELWQMTEDTEFVERFPQTSRRLRVLLLALAEFSGLVEDAESGLRAEDTDRETDAQLVTQLRQTAGDALEDA